MNPEMTEDQAVHMAEKMSHKKNWTALTRRGCAFVVAATGGALTVMSYWVHDLRICHPVSGGTPFKILSSCGPWSLSELLPFLAVAGMLILPDLSELSILSLFTLKREVAVQKQEIATTTSRQDALERSVHSQLVSLQAIQGNNANTIVVGVGDVEKLPSRIEAKHTTRANISAADLLITNGENLGVDSGSPETRQERALLTLELIETWERLKRYVDIAEDRGGTLKFSPRDNEILQRWYTLYRDELMTVRAARNAAAHPREPIDINILKSAESAAQKLESYLKEALKDPH